MKDDLLAGFTVTMVAVPLNLAIAIGSGVPPEVSSDVKKILIVVRLKQIFVTMKVRSCHRHFSRCYGGVIWRRAFEWYVRIFLYKKKYEICHL